MGSNVPQRHGVPVTTARYPGIPAVADGSEAVGTTPDEFRAHLTAERDKWAKVIRDRGIRGK